MRWPWERVPWGRGRGADASDSAVGDADSPAPGSADPAPAGAFQSAPAAPAAWSRLPPLQRSVADSTAIAPPAAFRSSLTTHQNPSFLAPLGHLVDPDGPAGVVGGLASSVGGPISYEGVDELRVPERPAPPSAPAVQRRIATLRPEPAVVQRQEDAAVPTYSPGHDHDETAETSLIESGSLEVTGPAASEPAALEIPAPAPLVVARSMESPPPLPSGQPEAGGSGSTGVVETGAGQAATLGSSEAPVGGSGSTGVVETGAGQAATLGSSEAPVGSTGGPSPVLDAAVPTPAEAMTTPLTVPVQRSASSAGSSPASSPAPRQLGDVGSATTLRPVSWTSPLAADTGLNPPSANPSPSPGGELMVARSASEPAARQPDEQPNRQPDEQPVDDPSPTAIEPDPAAGDAAVVGLLDSRPLVESSSTEAGPPPGDAPTGDAAPLTVPSGANPSLGSGPTLQRQLTDRPTATSPAGPTPVAPVVASGAVPTPGATPIGTAAPAGSPTAGLDDQGYPPLIARSVQRSTVGAEGAGRGPALGAAAPSPDSGVPATPPAPLSGFSAAISALRDPPLGPPHNDSDSEESADGPGGSSQDPPLVVARRVAPDQNGQLPPPEVHLQRAVPTTGRLAPPPTPVQRSLIAGGSPLAPPPATLGNGAATSSAPAVQRLHYEDAAAPSESLPTVDQPTGADDQPGTGGAHEVSAMEMPTAPASAAWSPVAPAPGPGSSTWSSPLAPSTTESWRSGASRAAVQRTAAEPSSAAVGTTTFLRSGKSPAPIVPPPMAAADPTPMIQRRFDPPSPGTTVAPPVSTDPTAMAVSSRTVGLAEMFAMAAAQSSGGDATIQRSAETEVQLAADPPAATPAATPAAAGAGPAGPAAPMSGAELEEMARRLYEPLSARLRAELWQDRERSGLLTDLRP